MKILYLNHNVIWQSTFQRCFLFARELALKGHIVTLVTNSQSARLLFRKYIYEGVEIIECPDLLWENLRTGWDPINVIRRCIFLHNKRFDIIHAFDTRPTVILPALIYKLSNRQVPLVIDWADWWGRGGAISLRKNKILNLLFSPIETFFEEYFRRFANHSTVISTLLKKRAINLGLFSKSVSLIYSGADIRNFRKKSKLGTRNLLKLEKNAHLILFPANVLYDLTLVLKTFQLIHESDIKSYLVLIGEFPEHLPIPQKIQNRIIRVGSVSRTRLLKYLSAADVGIIPLSDILTNRARVPMKFGDFLAAELPFVTNPVGDMHTLVKKNSLAYISQSSPRAMAKTIMWILNHRKEAQIQARSARINAQENYSLVKSSAELENLYKFILKLGNFRKVV